MDSQASSGTLALDIGGANLKAFDGCQCTHRRFPLWQHPELLTSALRELSSGDPDYVAVTMTGELCDCFRSRHEGVLHIADCVAKAFPASELRFYSVNGGFCELSAVDCRFEDIASANWHAIATWLAGNFQMEHGLLVDFGSTTTDLIPIVGGQVAARGACDWARMQHRELVYTGFGRTPLSMVMPTVQGRNHAGIVLAAEIFSTMQDAYLISGWCEEDARRTTTADGRPFQYAFALARMARHFCSEPETIGESFLRSVAAQAVDAQWLMLREAIEHQLANANLSSPEHADVYLIGEGGEALRRLIGERMPHVQCQLPLHDFDHRRATGAVATWHLMNNRRLAGSCR